MHIIHINFYTYNPIHHKPYKAYEGLNNVTLLSPSQMVLFRPTTLKMKSILKPVLKVEMEKK